VNPIVRGVLVLLLLLSVTDVAQAESLDSKWYRQIHERWLSSTLDPVMNGASKAGEASAGMALCLAGETFGKKREKDSAKLAAMALGGSGLVVEGLKGMVNRSRPDGDESGRWNSSFPSGHATGAFSLATVVAAKYRKLAIPAYLGATVIGLSRIYLGRHYPSDVAAGAALGVASGILVIKFQGPILRFEL
jgi:membrane-associated phospholipid phosphatase